MDDQVSVVRPVALGYQASRVGSGVDELVNGRRVLTAFAEREGFALAAIFVEVDLNRPLSAFGALIQRARQEGAEAVVVAAAEDLGRIPRVRQLMRERLEREAGVRVLIAQPLPARLRPSRSLPFAPSASAVPVGPAGALPGAAPGIAG